MPATETKTCPTCKSDFTLDADDRSAFERVGLPLPEECHLCRLRRLFAFWLYGRFRVAKSAKSGQRIITVIPKSAPFPIWDRQEWLADDWDPLEYGRDYDPERPFFDQLKELQDAMPHPHQTAVDTVNCEWSDDVWHAKNCYLCRAIIGGEDISYCYRAFDCKNSIDLVYCFDTELSYDCTYCFKCYRVKYALNCRDCIDSAFIYDCRNCQDCFMSWNLRNKRYCILNQQYSKKEYFEKLKEFDLRSWSGVEDLRRQFESHVAEDAIHRQDFNLRTVDSTGNFMTDCKGCHECAFLERSENCRYLWRNIDCKEVVDAVGTLAERSGLLVLCDEAYAVRASISCWNSRHSEYLAYCEDIEYCFGCVSLRNKKYCILNKQYTKEEYEKLRDRIIADMKKRGEWGKLPPMSFIGFGYNVSYADIFFPAAREEALALGALWHEEEDGKAEGMPAEQLPDNIDEVEDDIAKQPLICPETGLRYNIAPHELRFYREHGIPLPRLHFDHRILSRFRPLAAMAGPAREGKCALCDKSIQHYFHSDSGYEKIACVECYQERVA